MSDEPVPRWKQRLGGVFIAGAGACGTAYVWHTVLTEGRYRFMIAGMMPVFFVMGVALILFPGYKEERIRRGEDISRLSGPQLLTPRWWVVFVVAMAAGIGNLLLIRSGAWQAPPG